MKPRHAQPRSRTALGVSLCAVIGLAIGAAGTSTVALWNDHTPLNGTVTTGYEYFAAGTHQGALATPTVEQPDTVVVPSASWAAAAEETLIRDQEVAVVFETQSLSQGNKGLFYQIHEPENWGDSVFSHATIRIFWVPNPGACAVGVTPPATPDTVAGLESVPVSSDYSTTTAAVTEYWCLAATYTPPRLQGEYDNTARVTGRATNDEVLTATDEWWVKLEDPFTPIGADTPPISFTYSTFRPQGALSPFSAASDFGGFENE